MRLLSMVTMKKKINSILRIGGKKGGKKNRRESFKFYLIVYRRYKMYNQFEHLGRILQFLLQER